MLDISKAIDNITDSTSHSAEHVIQFLNALEQSISVNTNYKAKYSGKRDYFIGHKFLRFPWKFVFVYKQDNTASIHIESYEKEGTDKIRILMQQYKEEMEREIGYSLELVPGSKNKDLLRLMIRINYLDMPLLVEKVTHYTAVFIKFKNALENRF